MRLILTGLANSGKTTMFNALTGQSLETPIYPTPITEGLEPHRGIVKVPDQRVKRLSQVFKPKKTTYATIEYLDYPGMTSGDIQHNLSVFRIIKDSDAILHVVRAFEDESIIHPSGGVDPLRDVALFEDELILGDLEFVERRLQKIEELSKKGKKIDELDRRLLIKCKEALENEIALRYVEFSAEERAKMLTYQFLTTMPEIIVLNIHERDIKSEKVQELRHAVAQYFGGKGTGIVPPIINICAKIEMEISQIEEEERVEFLRELGLDEPAVDVLARKSYEALGLITFFTVVSDEVRAWTIKRGTRAQEAAGKIHSDMQRGFIRAEVVHYDDFVASGESMQIAREKGLVRLEGRDYIVQDGDIINFKFNV
jgi:hypothetical protein